MDRQDRQGVRTAEDVERRHNYGKTFAEVFNLIEETDRKVDEATEALDKSLTADEIFKRLTNGGEDQGIYREDGKVYINAEYIRAIDKLFANDIIMSGKFTHSAKGFLEPGEPEETVLQNHILNISYIPAADRWRYDFNNDGILDVIDLLCLYKAKMGVSSLSGWSKAEKSDLTLTIDLKNPERFITVSGTNMWGREVTSYYGVNFTTARNPLTESKISAVEERMTIIEEKITAIEQRIAELHSSDAPAEQAIQVGSNVKVRQGADYWDGVAMNDIVYGRVHQVAWIRQDPPRACIAFQGVATGVVLLSDLYLV